MLNVKFQETQCRVGDQRFMPISFMKKIFFKTLPLKDFPKRKSIAVWQFQDKIYETLNLLRIIALQTFIREI